MKVYLKGIDGLRAVAVAAVVLFHAVPHALPGGFIGVDIFFAISGYIITRTYFDDLSSGRVSLRHFYLKRLRRLSPAYVVVLAITTGAAFVLLTPPLLNSYAASLVAQPVYLQNLAFWQQGDYFEKALGKPLLHTWSLAVEEQFYLLYGLLILIATRFRRASWALVVIACMCSVAFGLVAADVSPKTAFYLLPARIWEFGLGMLAARLPRCVSQRAVPLLGYTGVALVAASIGLFDATTPFPGPQAVLACTGTVLALHAIGREGWRSQWLESRPATYLGRISYSLYLWHWPLIALPSIALGRSLSAGEAIIAVGVSTLLAMATERLIETPFRRSVYLARPSTIITAAVCAGLLTMAVGAVLIHTGGAVNRYKPEIANLYRAQQARAPFRCSVAERLRAYPAEMCHINKAEGPGGLLIIGDSHADQLHETLAALGDERGVPVYLAVRNCNLEGFTDSGFCGSGVLRTLLADIHRLHVADVVATSFMKETMSQASMQATVDALAASDAKRIFIMQDVPNGKYFSPEEHLAALLGKRPMPAPVTMDQYTAAASRQLSVVRAVAATSAKVTILYPADVICRGGTCPFDVDGKPVYFDEHHLSPTGVRLLAPMFRDAFARGRVVKAHA